MAHHGTEVRHKALTLLRDGRFNADVARMLEVPVGTVGYWKHMDRAKRGECPGRKVSSCPRCDGRDLDRPAYSYLLALYLGDGHISHYSTHRVPNLMIACTESWPGLMEECEVAMKAVFPENSVCRVRRTGCSNVKVYSRHLRCLFPQHGRGKKHDRLIALEPWQVDIMRAHPWEFIRGLIHSDGCRVTNWTTRMVGGEPKRYEYPRYFFTNKSDDIRQLCCDALDLVGVEWKITVRAGKPFNVSVARKASVALMDAHVGPKY
ncbi:helix-turn-helix domain-containing protein [Streptomyces abyssomicinicus]|uniref:helix-turn-helix domain-containing protein n=1 Tax=Streptomyces abyssomicinicus TaxID=574929 RepID=UPI0012504C51|nr:helix-turn-helix domain-containing protein [Streptomyces abyssomicinicus]